MKLELILTEMQAKTLMNILRDSLPLLPNWNLSVRVTSGGLRIKIHMAAGFATRSNFSERLLKSLKE